MNEPRLVLCSKLNRELPGLPFQPFPDEFGQLLFDRVSHDAWKMWIRESPRYINTYHLDLQNPQCQAFLRDQMRIYFGLQEGELVETAWTPPED